MTVLYSIDEELRLVTLYEIEDTSPLTDAKLRHIASWAFHIDSLFESDVKLIVTDRYGMNQREISLFDAWYAIHAHSRKPRD